MENGAAKAFSMMKDTLQVRDFDDSVKSSK